MKRILPIILFYVTIIHFCVRAIFVAHTLQISYRNRTEADYYKWEGRWFVPFYLLVYVPIIWGDPFSFWVTFGLFSIIAMLRSIEHICPKFLD